LAFLHVSIDPVYQPLKELELAIPSAERIEQANSRQADDEVEGFAKEFPPSPFCHS
jgi:hypothetical protein